MINYSKPTQKCLMCGCINDNKFRYCHFCGQRRVEFDGETDNEKEEFSLQKYNEERRIFYLENMISKSAYNKKKLALKNELENFLKSQSKNMHSATPEDIRLFLLRKDVKGKTSVHELTCVYLGSSKGQQCHCPKRLAHGTVASLIGQLKSLFDDFGRKGEWVECDLLKYGNPVVSTIVSRYLDAVKLEQCTAHVPIKQAKPLFVGKLKAISEYIDKKLTVKNLNLGKRFIFLRDQAFFKVQFFAGDRANDLGLCLAQEIKVLPEGRGLLFSHTVGKTLGNGKVNEFVISPVNDKMICPVKSLYNYVNGVKALDIDISTGYLFRALDASHISVLESPVSSSGMCARLQGYLKELNIFEGETIHSIRGGCAITLASTGAASCDDIMKHVGWLQKGSCDRYSRINKLVDSTAVSSLFAKVADADFIDATEVYKNYGDTASLPHAF